MSLPVMKRQKYSKTLALGTVAGAGCLGILIPPSIMLVIMGDQMGLSVGDLFMGAVFPGMILGLFYIFYILGFSFFKPASAPLADDVQAVSLKVVWGVFKTILPPAALILAVLARSSPVSPR